MSAAWQWARRARRLATHLPARTGGAVLGDLVEEYRLRRAERGRWWAEWWLATEMSSLRRAYRRESGRRRRWLVPRGEWTQTFRSLRRTPSYALALAGVIALSMALCATVFAIVDGTLFKPLPYRQSNRLFAVSLGYSQLSDPLRPFMPISPAEFHEWPPAIPDARLTAFIPGFQVLGVHDSVVSAYVDAAFFDVIGMRPIIGGFTPSDFQATGPIRAAVISQEFWQNRFARDPAVIGRTLVDDTGKGIRVAGVLPADFVYPRPADRRFVPELLTALVDVTPRSAGRSLSALVRLSASVTTTEAAAQLTAAEAAWAATQPVPALPPGVPERNRILRGPYDRVGLTPIRDAMIGGDLSGKSWIVFEIAAGLVLLACLNCAGLTIARVRDRWRDLAVRRSLGARYHDLVRLLALENAAIVALGTAAGIGGAYFMLAGTLRLIGGAYMVVLKPPAIDARVLVFCALASIICIACVTALAARATTQTSMQSAIGEGGGTTRRARARLSMVTAEVTVALVIAVGGALVVGSLMRVWAEDPGVDVRDTAVITMTAPAGAAADEIEQLVTDVSHIPGVVHAGGSANLIFAHVLNSSAFDAPKGVMERQLGAGFAIESVAVTRGYLEAAGLRAIDGRLPTDAEFTSGAPVIVVSDIVTKQYWPGQRAVGQSLLNKGRPFTVVGVVPDVRAISLDLDSQGEIYWPLMATPRPSLANVLIRFAGHGREALNPAVSRVIQLCPKCWVRSGDMLTDALSDSIRSREFSAWLFSAFGLSGLLIVGVGILGLVAMTTNRRTREIGIRMALGATVPDVVRQIVREQVMAVAAGLVMGGILAAWVVRFVASYLYKTPVYDPWSWAAAVAALLVVSTIGALVPARRASRIDPVRALRVE